MFLGGCGGVRLFERGRPQPDAAVRVDAGILAYTGWFTGQHFADSVGWPIALIAFGIFMIGLSALAMRIDRLYVRGAGASHG